MASLRCLPPLTLHTPLLLVLSVVVTLSLIRILLESVYIDRQIQERGQNSCFTKPLTSIQIDRQVQAHRQAGRYDEFYSNPSLTSNYLVIRISLVRFYHPTTSSYMPTILYYNIHTYILLFHTFLPHSHFQVPITSIHTQPIFPTYVTIYIYVRAI